MINPIRNLFNELVGFVSEIIGFISSKAITGMSSLIWRLCLPDISYSRWLWEICGLADSIERSCVVAVELFAVWVWSTKSLLPTRLLTFICFPPWLLCLVLLVLRVVIWLILVDVSYSTVVGKNIDLVFSATHRRRIILRLATRVGSAASLLISWTSLHIERSIHLRVQQHCWIILLVNKLVVAYLVLWTHVFVSTSCQRFCLSVEGDCLPMLCKIRF